MEAGFSQIRSHNFPSILLLSMILHLNYLHWVMSTGLFSRVLLLTIELNSQLVIIMVRMELIVGTWYYNHSKPCLYLVWLLFLGVVATHPTLTLLTYLIYTLYMVQNWCFPQKMSKPSKSACSHLICLIKATY